MKWWLLLALWMAVPLTACVWDSDALRSETRRRPTIAALIRGEDSAKVDHKELQARIERLLRSPRPSDTNWVNEVGGAYLRTGKPAKAVELLEPAAKQFPNDYGVHANLGTAYHLLGRYKDAERHIARDLEINPDAHFGLEKYHLALLQYLSRDAAYQKAHVYVDEFTSAFNDERLFVHGRFPIPQGVDHDALREKDAPPYRFKWNLARDTNLLRGVEYMAQLNPREPSVWVMLGMACVIERDKNLAIAAFRKGVAAGSQQRSQLERWINALDAHIVEARALRWSLALAVCGPILLFAGWKKLRHRRRLKASDSEPG